MASYSGDMVICRHVKGGTLVYWGYTGETDNLNMAIRYRTNESARYVLKTLGHDYFCKSYYSLMLETRMA